ncbi:hypothetical protein HBHAL_1445 [Halobacillus halophilus DSM 2266]|uniref:Right handed beta helix domain-containing protein n=1 Tax=Halobacillus halophilus (strain ATCC 35676 / DSM 2266 / JCM 20832 / KCTC 3685 / LMG 17431 / NBRC 102448 / NCIMB 2269) TaxID=866895 RepID=I0JI49_HALH3|nr:hypothetical protein [Halobacillus halophilus]CCG43817.1 hypothetical protein HBHAL_1445 [Halobacillus halophilus DSM 2266]
MCVISNISCSEIPQPGGRREQQFTLPSGAVITLQQVRILITGTANVTLDDGRIGATDFSICETYYLCAPSGTNVECQITSSECFVCTIVDNPIETLADVNVNLCVGIQSTANVTVALEAMFCQPREQEFQLSCPTPIPPLSCSTQVTEATNPCPEQNPLRATQTGESFCFTTDRVYDWVQNQVESSVTVSISPLVCVYEVTSAEGNDCTGISQGDLVCYPCTTPCEETLVCTNGVCGLVLTRTSETCVPCPSGAIELSQDFSCQVPGGRVFNVTQGIFYNEIQPAVDDANPNDFLIVFPGEYPQTTFLTIDKPLTITGFSAEVTNVIFPDSLTNTTSLRLQADNITISDLSFFGPTDLAAGDEALLLIPQRGIADYYQGITIRDSVISGGERNAFIKAEDLTLTGNTFIHTGDENSIEFQGVLGETVITNNTFLGSPTSRGTLTFQQANNDDVFDGTIRIEGNTMEQHTQFALFNTSGFINVSVFIRENNIDHQDRPGSSIIFLPFNFPGLDTILIEENSITNPNENRFAVYVDYRFGGTTSPNDDQIQVVRNFLDVAQPWGTVDDTASLIAPVGFTTIGAAFTMSLGDFDLVDNTVIM